MFFVFPIEVTNCFDIILKHYVEAYKWNATNDITSGSLVDSMA